MDSVFIAVSAIIVCSSLLAWLACRGRQPIMLGYFLCGVILGPSALGVVPTLGVLDDMSRLGVTLLLFLAGLVLHPHQLRTFFRTAAVVTLAGSAFTWVIVAALLRLWGQSAQDSMIAAVALMFSSTVLVVKLLPTTTLHQRRMGAICIAVLIAEDLLAVMVLLLLGPASRAGAALLWLPAKVVLLIGLAVVVEQFVVRRMMLAAGRYSEVLLMLCLGWCVGVGLAAESAGIPFEVGAFVAGVAMARGKVAPVLSEQLKPLRDFFLMFFFFVLGASFDFLHLGSVWLPAVLVAVLIVSTRPFWLRWLLGRLGEERAFAAETGVRLGQASEFALIIAVAALQGGHLTPSAAHLVQLATVLTMLISSYIVVMKYPTPIGTRAGLQRD